jgi:hypothetical protein
MGSSGLRTSGVAWVLVVVVLVEKGAGTNRLGNLAFGVEGELEGEGKSSGHQEVQFLGEWDLHTSDKTSPGHLGRGIRTIVVLALNGIETWPRMVSGRLTKLPSTPAKSQIVADGPSFLLDVAPSAKPAKWIFRLMDSVKRPHHAGYYQRVNVQYMNAVGGVGPGITFYAAPTTTANIPIAPKSAPRGRTQGNCETEPCSVKLQYPEYPEKFPSVGKL